MIRALLLFAITLLAYVPAMGGAFFWDDESYITDNPALRSADGLRQIWTVPEASPQYYPLVFTSYWVEYHLWGLAPAGYHCTNIALHALNAVLLWMVLHRLAIPGAFLAAAVFAVHPVHVESVAWVTERKDLLLGTFYLLALLAWLRFVATHRWRDYALALVLFVCAMLSKTSACTLPLVLLLLAWWKEPVAPMGSPPYQGGVRGGFGTALEQPPPNPLLGKEGEQT